MTFLSLDKNTFSSVLFKKEIKEGHQQQFMPYGRLT